MIIILREMRHYMLQTQQSKGRRGERGRLISTLRKKYN